MPEYLAPGVYIEEVPSGVKTIEGVSTSTCAFIGVTTKGPINKPTLVTNLSQFYAVFGRPLILKRRHYLAYAVEHFFREGGVRCYVVRVAHYTNIQDETSLAADYARGSFDDDAGGAVMTVRAASQGEWGKQIAVAIQNSSKFSTSLDLGDPAASLAAGSHGRIKVTSTDGMERGTLLWLVRPVFATVTYTGGAPPVLELVRSSLYRDLDYVTPARDRLNPMANGTTIAADSLLISPDFRYMARITGPAGGPAGHISLGAGNPQPELVNEITAFGSSAPYIDVFGNRLPESTAVWIIEPEQQVFGVVERVEGKEVVFRSPVTTTVDFPHGTMVLARDFTLYIRDGRDPVETFANLSMEDTNQMDWIVNRVNLGASRSRHISVTAVSTDRPMRNVSFTNLSGTGNLDGLDSLDEFDFVGSSASQTGLFALDTVDDVSILAVPFPNIPDATGAVSDDKIKYVYNSLTAYCNARKYCFGIIDCKPGLDATQALAFKNTHLNASNYGAYYYPWIKIRDPQTRKLIAVPPSGAIAGIYADTDTRRGVHKAPAGIVEGYVDSAAAVERVVTEAEQKGLNKKGVNVIRTFSDSGINVWGVRTIATDPEWKYVNVRRLLIFIEKSIELGTQWVVFEPNNLQLWRRIERNIRAFLRTVWRSGALFGETEDKAFYVKCDSETNTPETIEGGQVITEIGVAPVKPAEFVIFRISQAAAGSSLSE